MKFILILCTFLLSSCAEGVKTERERVIRLSPEERARARDDCFAHNPNCWMSIYKEPTREELERLENDKIQLQIL